METRKQKRSPRARSEFTAVDTAILLLVLLTLGGTIFGWVYQSLTADEAVEDGTTYAVTFRIASTHRRVTEGLAAGDKLYDSDGNFLGYLRDDLTVSDDTDARLSDRVVGNGSMVCSGRLDGRSLLIGDMDHYLTPGDTYCIHTEEEILTVYILKIDEVSAQG